MNNLKDTIDKIPPTYHRVPVYPPMKGIAAMRLVFGGFFLGLDSVPGCRLRWKARLRTDEVQEVQSPVDGGREPGRGASAAARGGWRSV